MNWPNEITAFGQQWYLGWTHHSAADADAVAHYENREPAQLMVIRVVYFMNHFCASLAGDDIEGLDSALRELETVVRTVGKSP